MFTLKIHRGSIHSSFKYRVYLYDEEGFLIADSFTDTKWGSKRWAKRTKKEYLKRLNQDSLIKRIEI